MIASCTAPATPSLRRRHMSRSYQHRLLDRDCPLGFISCAIQDSGSGGFEVGRLRFDVEQMIIIWLLFCSVSTRPTNSMLAVDV